MEKIGKWIENIVEKKYWVIQAIYLFVLVVMSIIFKFERQTTDKIIIELLLSLIIEIFILWTNVRIVQKKIDKLDAKQDIDLGRLFRVADFDISPFFHNAQNNVFVSGIALNGFIKNCNDEITAFLGQGKTVYLLFSSPKLTNENAKLYFGVKNESNIEEYAQRVIRYQLDTVENIREKYKKYFLKGNLQIRLSNCVFSTSFVAYDFMQSSKKGRREIKASFYQYGCGQPQKEPNILLRSDDKKEWFDFFENTMKQQWDDADKIDTLSELDALHNMLRL